jgi:large repetitive protein
MPRPHRLCLLAIAVLLVGCATGTGTPAAATASAAPTFAATAPTSSSPAPSSLTITSPADGSTVSTSSVEVQGTAAPGATVIQDITFAPDSTTVADASGRWSIDVRLNQGQNVLRFRIGPDQANDITLTIDLVSAASSTPTSGPVVTTPPSAEPTIAPAPKATPKPSFTYKGSGTRKSAAFTITLPARVTYSFFGSGNFIADINATDGSGTIANVANVIGTFKTTTWVYGDDLTGRVYLDVIADGSWTVTVTSDLRPAAHAVPAAFSGKWGLTTTPFSASGDVLIKFSHKGSGNFIVDLIDASTGDDLDLVVNEIGHTSGATNEYGLGGTYAFDVTADGAWTITVSAQ